MEAREKSSKIMFLVANKDNHIVEENEKYLPVQHRLGQCLQ